MKFTCQIAMMLLAAACASCQSPSAAASSTSPSDSLSHHRGITHIVICWQNHSGDATERQALLGAVGALRAIPGVETVAVGTMLPSSRPIVDSTWDVAYVITFPDQEAMNAYLTNPMHVRLKHEVLDPNVREIKAYDLRVP